jgi:hypothetical protein
MNYNGPIAVPLSLRLTDAGRKRRNEASCIREYAMFALGHLPFDEVHHPVSYV